MRLRFAGALLAACALAACGGVTSPSKNKIENFGGVVPVAGAGPVHQFTASSSGEFTITIDSLNPSVAAYFYVLFGQVVGGQCGLLQANQFATVGVAAAAGPIDKGTYCVQIQDEGFFTVDETYNIKVSHP